MALSYKARRRWSLVILLVGLPVYVVLAVTLVNMLERPSVPLELAIYVGLGFLWMMPFKFVFRGIGQPDPDAPRDPARNKPQ
jgi:Protein of unknown function (DUF2842)